MIILQPILAKEIQMMEKLLELKRKNPNCKSAIISIPWCFYDNGYKITIDEVVKSTLGFSSNEVNGTILEIRPNLVVKHKMVLLKLKDTGRKLNLQ